MGFELEELYRQMLRARCFEEMAADLWRNGLISGEMHLGTGEEAIIAGVLAHLTEGDALALDHRPTPALVMRGVDPTLLLLEMLGSEQGLCGGQGGHMHLFSREHLAASSGIVGASGPLCAGFALAASHLRPGAVAVSFFGEGAFNQGMVMESLNLAAAWRLPVVFVCKDNSWAITTRSGKVTGGSLLARARSFGMPAVKVNGTDVGAVWRAAAHAIARARSGCPSFILARCPHHEGHFLGDPMLLVLRRPLQQMAQIMPPLAAAFLRRNGAGAMTRLRSVTGIVTSLGVMGAGHWFINGDPLASARRRLGDDAHRRLEEEVREEMFAARARAIDAWGKERAQWA